MTQQMNKTGSVRPERRFRPGAEETQPGLGSTGQLETRLLLSHSAHRVEVAAQARPSAHPARVTPATTINDEYDKFQSDFLKYETTSQSSAASIFPSYITNRTNQMAIELVQYFNSLPLKLPFLNAPPHTPNNRGAVQKFVYDSIAGGSSSGMSLQASLLAIPLPTTTGTDLEIYKATVSAAIEQSRIQTLNGVSEVYAKALYISAPSPNNRFGVVAPKTIPSYYTSG